jgi:hypothetical protein
MTSLTVYFFFPDFFCSALFDKETGIVAFLQKVAGDDEVMLFLKLKTKITNKTNFLYDNCIISVCIIQFFLDDVD